MGTAVFVGNLDPQTSRQELVTLLSTAGGVHSVRIPLDRVTQRPRGFAFVDFADRESAERAIRDLDGAPLGGRRLRLRWALEKSPRPVFGRSGEGPPADRVPFEPDDWPIEGLAELADYAPHRRGRPKRGGKHGSDRKHGRGQRRYID